MSVDASKWTGSSTEIAEVVLDQVRSALPENVVGELTLDTRLGQLGLDSLATMEAVNRIESVFGIRFSEESLYDIECCHDLVRCVEQRLTLDDRLSLAGAAPSTSFSEARNTASGAQADGDVTLFAECLALQQRLADTEAAGLVNPFFRIKQAVRTGTATVNHRPVVSFTSFDYLGLAEHPRVVAAAQDAIGRFGTSASASRLVGGNSTLLAELDDEIARFVGTESAVVFPSGYGTNASVLGHLFGEHDLILYDELAHNSIVQGSQLSKARRRAFPHNDYEFVDRLLTDVRHEHRRVVVAIEGVYSMDGDFPYLPGFIEVKQRHQALLYVDEAHSIGVMGPTGRGICEHFDVDPADGDLWMGTISKALASGGGYLAGRKMLVQYLKYTTPALVFATACSPANTAAALAAIGCIRDEPFRLQRWRDNAMLFRKLASDCGLDTGASNDTPIVPVIVGSSARALDLSEQLLCRGVDAQPILYPAVPESGARLRFFITAHHTEQQIATTVEWLADCMAHTS